MTPLRSRLARLASTLPEGSSERRELLALLLQKEAGHAARAHIERAIKHLQEALPQADSVKEWSKLVAKHAQDPEVRERIVNYRAMHDGAINFHVGKALESLGRVGKVTSEARALADVGKVGAAMAKRNRADSHVLLGGPESIVGGIEAVINPTE